MGSYIAMAIEARDLPPSAWATPALLVAILLYDQLLFRPLVAWADKFRFEEGSADAPRAPGCWTGCAAPPPRRAWPAGASGSWAAR